MNGDSSIFVIILGLATTFIGLICIILLAKIMSFFCQLAGKLNNKKAAANSSSAGAQNSVQPAAPKGEAIQNRGEVVAAISAAIAEDMGKDVSAIRILSIKKI